MLVTAEGTLKDSKGTVLVVEWISFKRKSTWKKKAKKLVKKQKTEVKPKKDVAKKAKDKKKYFYYNIEGHWRRNCLAYLAMVKKKKTDVPFEGTSKLFIIESNLMIFSSSNWILNYDSSAYLCTSMQDLEEVRGLREGEIVLRVDNGARIATMAIEIYPL